MDPDPTFQIISDPDPTLRIISDPDPTCRIISDPIRSGSGSCRLRIQDISYFKTSVTGILSFLNSFEIRYLIKINFMVNQYR